MSNTERSFNENLDLLIKLLRKLKDKSKIGDIPGMPNMFFVNFDFFIENYERMKNQISEQLLQQFGEPIKQMVADMVEQLQEEVGELEPDIVIEPEPPVITGDKKSVEDIDELLKNPNLSDDEIDKLLDERTKLKSKDPEKQTDPPELPS
jgi:actin-like ATPase involved in cell morphogenesis